MRGVLAVVGMLGACYAPVPPLGVPCSDTSGCPSGQVCVSQVCVLGSLEDGAAVPADWWDVRWKRRRPIDITAGAALPPGYSLSITIDHAAEVAAGRSLASGDDLRVVRDDGSEAPRVLDSGAAFASSTTMLWFATVAPITAGARYWLYSDRADAPSPPADAGQVFVLAEDFEGTLGGWTTDPKVELTTTRAHRGSQALFIAEPQMQTGIGAQHPTGLRDLVFDAWWNIDDLTNADISQLVRSTSSSVYFTNLQPPGPRFDISKIDGGAYSQLIPPPPGSDIPAIDKWFRVTVYAFGLEMAVDIGGTRYVPATGFSMVDNNLAGNVGFSGFVVPSHVWWDDATARQLVVPEPAVELGAEQTVAGTN